MRLIECEECSGSGEHVFWCNSCNGSGLMGIYKRSTCYICKGKGSSATDCIACGGKGEVSAPCDVCGEGLTEANPKVKCRHCGFEGCASCSEDELCWECLCKIDIISSRYSRSARREEVL
jgi:hypothetical protein